MIKVILAHDKTSQQLKVAGWFYAFISFSFLKIVEIHLDGTRYFFCKVGIGFSVEHGFKIFVKTLGSGALLKHIADLCTVQRAYRSSLGCTFHFSSAFIEEVNRFAYKFHSSKLS